MSKVYGTKAAVQYLADKGFETTRGTMEVWRCKKRGPEYLKINNRPYYTKDSLDSFLAGKPVKTVDAEA
jgi:hypothetical protein